MTDKKTIKVVTLIIVEKRLYDEQDGVLLFKNPGRGKNRGMIMFPKKVMYNFEKVIAYFPNWKGREKCKALKFDIPLWLYLKRESEIKQFDEDVIVRNTHK